MDGNLKKDANLKELLLQEFYKLETNDLPESRKRLNHFIIKVKENIQDDQELNTFTEMIRTTDITQQNLKIKILLQLRCNDQLLDMLKKVDSIASTDITTNLEFLSYVFSKMKCEHFFKIIAPFIPFSATEKIINRLGKVLTDDILAEEYFEAVRSNYGLNLAKAILPACRIDFAKRVIKVNKLSLTSRELLTFARKDKTFIKFYFDILWKYTTEVDVWINYKKVVNYVGKTDADLFWQLHRVYDFNTGLFKNCFGKSVFSFLSLNDMSKATNRRHIEIFKPRVVYDVLKKQGKIYILLANLCEGDENEFFKLYFENNNEFSFFHKFLNGMPALAYSDLHKAYELKFGKNLLDNIKLFNGDWLERMSSVNRAIVLDILVAESHDLYYLYDLEKSIPLLKEKTKTDVENCELYLMQMYKSCEFYKNEDALLEVLTYIVQAHREEHNAINGIIVRMFQHWQGSEKLKPKIWNLIDEMMSILLYCGDIPISAYLNCYISKHLLHNIDYEKPFNNLLVSVLDMRTDGTLCFQKTGVSYKIYYEKFCNWFRYLSTTVRETEIFDDMYSFFWEILTFNPYNNTNQKSLFDYGSFVEICGMFWKYHLQIIITNYANNYPKSHYCCDLVWRRLDDLDYLRVSRFLENHPTCYRRYLFLHPDIMEVIPQIRWNYISDEIKRALHDYCVDILLVGNYTPYRLNSVSKLLLKVNETTFLTMFKKIWIRKRDSQPNIKVILLSQYLTQIRNVSAAFPIFLRFYKESEGTEYQVAVLRCLQLMPLNESKITINNLSESPLVRLRKLSVSAAGILLVSDDLGHFISKMNASEIDPVVKRSLCKRAFHLFVRNQNDLNWVLLKRNINLSTGCGLGFISKFWKKLDKISLEYLARFICYTFEAIISDGSAHKWARALAVRLNSVSILDCLDTTFIQTIMKSFQFYEKNRSMNDYDEPSSTSNYHLEFIFSTSGEKQVRLLQFTLEQIQQYKQKHWSDFPKKSVFDTIRAFVTTFCAFALKLKPQNGIVNKFYTEWKLIFLQNIQPEFLILEFLDLFFECKCDVKEFCKKSNQLMRVYIAKYNEMILKFYLQELMEFIGIAEISETDFLTSFMHSKPDRLSYCAVLQILPSVHFVKFTQEPDLAKLIERLRLNTDPSVRLYYSNYIVNRGLRLEDLY